MIDLEEYADSGKLFDGHYKLLNPINTEGGTADVWLAVDVNTVDDPEQYDDRDWEEGKDGGVRVAIKVYRPRNALDVAGREKFINEFRIVFNCHHTNLLQPTYFSIYEDIPYLVLPYCRNGSSELLIGEMQDERHIWKYIHDVASGLAYLHALEPPIIHQDIKPANVLIDDSGNYAITDFGISTQSGSDSDEDYSGTQAYMAPERFDQRAEPCKESDIWALGATVYKLITGKVPFGEKGGYEQARKMMKPDFSNVKMSKDIKRVIEACMHIDPAKRPTAEELSQTAAQHLRAGNRWLKVTIILLAAVALAGVFAWWKSRPVVEEVKDYKVELVKWNSEKDAAVTYTGTLLNGVPHGKGKALYSDGATYEGRFVNGKRDDDSARYVPIIGQEYYPVVFVNDSIRQGVVKVQGVEFRGKFDENGHPVEGMAIFPNLQFEGEIIYVENEDNKLEILPSYGKMKNLENGEEFEGQFKDANFWNGKLYDKKGNLVKTYKNGIPINK